MSKGFFSKINILEDIELEKNALAALTKNKDNLKKSKEHENAQEIQTKFNKIHSEIEAETFIPEEISIPKPGAKPRHCENPIPNKLTVENGLTSTTVNGKTFEHDPLNEYER